MGKLATAAEGRQIQKNTTTEKVQTVIKNNWPRIAAVAPAHMNPERMMQIAISAINKSPKLKECTVPSLLSALMTCSANGLEPSAVDGLGRAYIIPYFNKNAKCFEAQFILGYRGMIELARRSGMVYSIIARPVYVGDTFDYSFGTDEYIKHEPTAIDRTPEKLTHVYLVAHFKDGGRHVDVMARPQIDVHRARSQSSKNGPWVTDYEAMALKTIIRANFRWLPASVEAQRATAADGTTGAYRLDIDNKGTVVDVCADTVEAYEHGTIDVDPSETAPAPVSDSAPSASRKGVCKSCGQVVDITDDATDEDIALIRCECRAAEWEVRGA
jgi:recombination protein RecT